MIENPPLLTLHRGWRRPDPDLIERFGGVQTANLVDAMEGRGALDWRIKPLDPANASVVGPALTAYAYPADIAAMFGAIAEAEPGDVIVLACDAFTGTAVIGDLAAGMMRNKGVAAFVTDGLARDRAGIVATGLPLFCAGIVPNSPAVNGPGIVGASVTLGGVHVRPGDVVVADADGVVVVPSDRLVQVLAALDQVRAAEAEQERTVKAGLVLPENVRTMVAAARVVEHG